MVARPDPLPFRTPTPVFDVSGPPDYAAAAKEKAQAELGGQVDPEAVAETPSYPDEVIARLPHVRPAQSLLELRRQRASTSAADVT